MKEERYLPRRGENIRKRKDGRWEARYPTGVNENGKKTYTSIYGTTYREVREKRNWVMRQQPAPARAAPPLFKDVLRLWIGDNRIRLKEATVCRYSYLIEKHIIPELGGLRIDKVTATVINGFLAEKMRSGRVDGKGSLSAAYVRSIMLVISAAIRFAADAKLCPPLLTQINKPPIQAGELPILSKTDQEKLENVLLYEMNPTIRTVLGSPMRTRVPIHIWCMRSRKGMRSIP